MKSTKVYLPKPCHEDLNFMEPVLGGRHCKTCNTLVVDFTEMTNEEVVNYIRLNGKGCGFFLDEQLVVRTNKEDWWWKGLDKYYYKHFSGSIIQKCLIVLIGLLIVITGCRSKNGNSSTKEKPPKMKKDKVIRTG